MQERQERYYVVLHFATFLLLFTTLYYYLQRFANLHYFFIVLTINLSVFNTFYYFCWRRFEKVREAQRRLKKVEERWRRLEKVGEGWRKLEKGMNMLEKCMKKRQETVGKVGKRMNKYENIYKHKTTNSRFQNIRLSQTVAPMGTTC